MVWSFLNKTFTLHFIATCRLFLSLPALREDEISYFLSTNLNGLRILRTCSMLMRKKVQYILHSLRSHGFDISCYSYLFVLNPLLRKLNFLMIVCSLVTIISFTSCNKIKINMINSCLELSIVEAMSQ